MSFGSDSNRTSIGKEKEIGKLKAEKNETKIEELNPKKEPLTVEILKGLLGNEEMSEEEAKEIIYAIKTLVSIIVDQQFEQELREKENTDINLKQAA